MEPITIVSLVGASVTLATKAASSLKDLNDLYKTYKGAADSIQFLHTDVLHAKELLNAYESQVPITDQEDPAFRDKVNACRIALKNICVFSDKHKKLGVEEKDKDKKDVLGFKAMFKRGKYTWSESDIKKHRDELRNRIQYLQWERHDLSRKKSVLAGRDRNRGPSTVASTVTAWLDDTTEVGSLRSDKTSRQISEGLIDAAEVGDVKRVNTCLDDRAEVDYLSRQNAPNKCGHAALHLAAEHGHTGVLKALITRGASLDLAELLGKETALHVASKNGQLAIVRYLITSGADVNARNQWGETPLLVATTEDIQIALLRAQADPNIKSIDGTTPLHNAIRMGFLETFRRLVSERANINARDAAGNSALQIACTSTNIAGSDAVTIVETLLLSSVTADTISAKEKDQMFYEAMMGDKLHIVRAFLNVGTGILSRVSSNGVHPLHRVASSGRRRILQELLRHVDPNLQYRPGAGTALFEAVANENIECIRLLLDSKADLSIQAENGLIPLHAAFAFCSASTAEILLKEHKRLAVDVNVQTKVHGILPIHLTSNPDMVGLWAKYGGHIDHQVRYRCGKKLQHRRSIMHFCVLHQSPAVVEAMFKNGATMNMLDEQKRNPLQVLCSTEEVWGVPSKSVPGKTDGKPPAKHLSKERLAVFKLLLQHGPFTSSCRDAIYAWKDKSLQDALAKELPWRSMTEMAFIAAKWTMYAGGTLVVGAAAAARLAARFR